MRRLLCTGLLLLALLPLRAQPAVPAQPADPNQARPAIPVTSDGITPAEPTPATPAQPTAASPAATSPSTTRAAAPNAPQAGLSVIADSSLKAVLQELAQTWADAQASSPQVPLTLTNAATLCTRVQADPSYDVVISADVADVKALTDKGVLAPDGQLSLARNTLVAYGRKALIKDDDLDWFDLVGSEWKKVALGSPDMVASGRVATRALKQHDLLDDEHKDVYVYAPTDALAMAMVQRDAADAVLLFKTDAARMNLHGFETTPIKTEDAPPIFYTAAVGRLAKNPIQARAFIDYCGGPDAKAIWAKYGFETN